MKYRYWFILFSLLVYQLAFSQENSAPVVENVIFEQRTDGSYLVDIYYDVYDADGDYLTINMRVSDDGGETWDFPCDEVSGDVGDSVITGTGKHIVWDFGAEHPETDGDQFRVRIIAEDWYWVTGTVTDVDGNTYQTIKIGDQWWMMENLKVTHYSNGDEIPNVINDGEWEALTTGAYCAYNNDENYVDTLGLLYNWFAVNDPRNIAPAGWHVPGDDEWKQLEMHLGMSQEDADAIVQRGTDEGGKLKEAGIDHWNSPNTGATNESGFTALPGNYRISSGTFSDLGRYGLWWTATEYELVSEYAFRRVLYYNSSQITRNAFYKSGGHSIRLVKD